MELMELMDYSKFEFFINKDYFWGGERRYVCVENKKSLKYFHIAHKLHILKTDCKEYRKLYEMLWNHYVRMKTPKSRTFNTSIPLARGMILRDHSIR